MSGFVPGKSLYQQNPEIQMRFTDAELDTHIRRRPSVQMICLGAFLQQPMPLSAEILAVPIGAAGFSGGASLAADYIAADLDLHITENDAKALHDSGMNAYPAVALVWHPVKDESTDTLLRSSHRAFEIAQRTLSLVAGNSPEVIAQIVVHETNHEYKLFPPGSRQRQRLWFSDEEATSFVGNIVRLSKTCEVDSRVSLALQLYLDALHDKSHVFRLVKLYNVLECLASPYKVDGVGSRDAVRKLLKRAPGPTTSISLGESQVTFDLIAVAGRIRDKIMHGARIDDDTFSANDKGALRVFAEMPFQLADALQADVDLCLLQQPSPDQPC
jgi:hypothetical protein